MVKKFSMEEHDERMRAILNPSVKQPGSLQRLKDAIRRKGTKRI